MGWILLEIKLATGRWSLEIVHKRKCQKEEKWNTYAEAIQMFYLLKGIPHEKKKKKEQKIPRPEQDLICKTDFF